LLDAQHALDKGCANLNSSNWQMISADSWQVLGWQHCAEQAAAFPAAFGGICMQCTADGANE
jgi:hypothetical protein